jgi:prepilin-type N-terminal cleavage/methylation domain-containing protein
MKKGFTMLEVLTCLIIIAALAGILLPRFTTTTAKTNQRQAESNLRAIRMAQKMYYARNGLYACSTACANAVAIQTGLGGSDSINIKDGGTYVYSMTSPTVTTFTATATGGSATLTVNQDNAWTKGGAAYTPS